MPALRDHFAVRLGAQSELVSVNGLDAVLQGMADLKEQSVNCAVSRLSDEQLAMRRVVAYVRGIFDGVKRVLADDGTAWLSVGDVVTGARGSRGSSLVSVPWRIALALQGDGWILRNAIVWSTAGEMSRRTLALSNTYETMLLFAKQRRYSFDLDAVRLAAQEGQAQRRNPGDVWFSAGAASPRPELPFDVASRCITAGCPREGVVVDPFHDAASVEFAAVQSGRRFTRANSERSDERQRWAA
ncbi:DNA methyltransferase [Lentzea sp. NPDC102401]|uniref:DNA methyltransferase n=1 Tax=Lentzea sp. NPDC102401 TaxID=3364128 RepID=UPI003821EBB2